MTYNGVKASFKKPAKGVSDKLTVTIPKGAAVTDGELVVTTKYEASATVEVDRVAAPTPTVTEGSTVTPTTAGEVTLTGTGLTGLKKVVVKNAAGKVSNGSKISVTSATSAKVTLPTLPAGDPRRPPPRRRRGLEPDRSDHGHDHRDRCSGARHDRSHRQRGWNADHLHPWDRAGRGNLQRHRHRPGRYLVRAHAPRRPISGRGRPPARMNS